MCRYNATAIHHNRARFADIAPLRWSRYGATANTKLKTIIIFYKNKVKQGFDPIKFALGFLGGAVGSKALSSGFKVIKDNPQLKEALKRELADTLAKGWEATTKQYPILKTLEPMRIVQSEKGRIAQAGHLINKIEKQEIYTHKEKPQKSF